MKTLKEELQGCLSEMQATAKKFEELMNAPGITWPELEVPERLGKVIRAMPYFAFPAGSIVTIMDNSEGEAYRCSCPGFDYWQWIDAVDLIIYTPEK